MVLSIKITSNVLKRECARVEVVLNNKRNSNSLNFDINFLKKSLICCLFAVIHSSSVHEYLLRNIIAQEDHKVTASI